MTDPHPVADLCRPYVEALPIAGAAVSTIGGLSESETLSSSDEPTSRIDEAQLDHGEGPCWDAVQTRGWVEAAPFASTGDVRWPTFREAVQDIPVGALFSIPLAVGGLVVGAVDLWSEDGRPLTPAARGDARAIGLATARAVLHHSLMRLESTLTETDDATPRATIHQATGMVMAQLDIDAAEATLVLRARAFADGRPLREIAREIIERRLDLSGTD